MLEATAGEGGKGVGVSVRTEEAGEGVFLRADKKKVEGKMSKTSSTLVDVVSKPEARVRRRSKKRPTAKHLRR